VIPSLAKIISKKLEVDIFISGSINQAGPITRINAQLIDSKTDEVYKSFQVDGPSDKMLYSVDSLSSMVMDFLIISKMVNDQPQFRRYKPLTTSPEAYSCYLQGEFARSKRDYKLAREMFAQALTIDSNYNHVKLLMAVAYINDGNYEEARKWSDKAYEKIDQMPVLLKILTNSNHAFFHETPAQEIAYLEQYLEIDDKFPGTYFDMGLDYSGMLQFDKAIPLYEKSLELFDKMDMKPWWIYNYVELGYAYHEKGQYKKEEKLYKKADADFPNETSLIWRKAILYLTKRDTARANDLIGQYRTIYRENAWSESALERNMGWAYTQANMPDKAEDAFRKSVSLDNKNPYWTYYLANFLIEQDRNIDEGIELADKALELSQGYNEWTYLDCKGWGLYKKGRYKESLDILQKAWDLRRTKAQYNHQAFLHLEAAKKAVAAL
jgi:tetratricopeptide (TPR) repeat protein